MKKLILTTITFTITLLGCSKEELPINEKSTTIKNLVDPPKNDTIKNDTIKVNIIKEEIKPNDNAMGFRSSAVLRVEPDFFYSAIDIDELTNNKSKFTAEFLKPYIRINSSEPNGNKYYEFKDEDFKEVKIQNFNYSASSGNITFKTSYKDVTSQFISTIRFDPNEYYRQKITINTAFVSKHYMRGVYEDLSGNIDNLLIYDHNKYTIELRDNSKYKEDNSDVLGFNFDLRDNKKDKIVATLWSDRIVGFKKLSLIGNEMKIYKLPDFEDAVKLKIKKIKNITNTDLTTRLEGAFENEKWIQKTHIDLNGNRLIWRDDYLHGRGSYADVYLKRYRFILQSAVLNGNDLMLKINLQQANEEIINATFDLIVKDVK